MTLLQIITNVASRTEKDMTQIISNNQTLKDFLIDSFNLVNKNFNIRYNWPWREKTTTIQTTANYTTGTVTVSQDSRTVTGSGTSFTSAMVGRFLKLEREGEMYEIREVTNGATLVLKDPYRVAGGSGLSYRIYRRYYELPPDCPMGSSIILWSWPRRSDPIPFKRFDESFQSSFLTGTPRNWTWYGLNRTLSTYNTGTISLTKDSKTLTGTNTIFSDNVFPGSKIIVGNNNYNVESVDSDTQITMVQNSLTDETNSVYRIETKNRAQIILSTVPDPVTNLYLTYPKRTYDLKNDNDETDIYEEYQIALSNIIYAYLLDKLTDNRSLAWLTVAEAQVRDVLRSIIEQSPIDQAPLVGQTSLSGYRPGLYS